MAKLFNLNKAAVAVSLIFGSLTLVGCGGDNDPKPVDPPVDKGMFADVQGYWNKKGYGEFVFIDDDKVNLYEFNAFGCIQTDVLTHDEAQEAIKEIKKTDAGKMSVQLKGDLRADIYHPESQLPVDCTMPINVRADIDAIVTFDYFWNTFNDYYAFFDEREVNWQQMYDQFRPQITDQTTEEQLFEIFSLMIEPLRDAHTSISSDEDNFGVGKTIPLENAMFGTVAQAYRSGQQVTLSEIEAWFYQRYLEIQKGYVTSQSLGQYPAEADWPTLVWGKTDHNIGLLVVNDMYSFAEDGQEVGANGLEGIVAAAKAQMAVVMEQLKDTDGIILDIRTNPGGTDDVSLAIAEFFADKEVEAFSKQPVNRVGEGETYSVTIAANPDAYTKPVFLLTSQQTTSAAEIFTMAMKQFDHVEQIGEETSGALSDVLTLVLPNGWSMSLSNEVYRDSQGQAHEVAGLQPDIHEWAYTLESLSNGKFETYETALKALNKWQQPQLSKETFEQYINELMTAGSIPGAAVAVVKSGEVVYQKGFGRADEEGRAVTADTPFFLASVSKTVLGTTMAQVEADNKFSIDEQVQPLLDFSIDYPDDEAFSPTFKHLVTHTSGIIDQEQTFLCSYYLLADNSSLFQLIDPSLECDDYIEADMGSWFTRYLQVGGDNYQAGNFTANIGYGPGKINFYSNVGTALAGFAMEKKVGQSLPELSKQYLFNPLGMSQSSWSIEGLPDDVASRYYFESDLGRSMPIPDYNAVVYPDGGAISSAADMAKYMIAVMNQGKYQGQQVLNAAAVEKMLTGQTEVASADRGVGYFWRLDGDYISHDGGDPGVRTQIWADLDEDIAIVLLSNGPSMDHDAAANAFEQMNALVKMFAKSQ